MLGSFQHVHKQLHIHSRPSPLETFPNLATLVIRRCQNMKAFVVSQLWDAAFPSLHDLTISDDHNFVSFSALGLVTLARVSENRALPIN